MIFSNTKDWLSIKIASYKLPMAALAFSITVSLTLVSCRAAISLATLFSKNKKIDHIKNNVELPSRLSEYKLFKGNLAKLNPAEGANIYELATPLFSDYAEKQRLFKLPKGTKLDSCNSNGLPYFPDGTIIAKTFFYYHNKTDTSKGRQIIETRILLKEDTQWNVGVYEWNAQQTEGLLISSGKNKKVYWVDEKGKTRKVTYHIPGNTDCVKCHLSGDVIIPIGPKLRNLNTEILRNNTTINQISYFEQLGLIQSIDPELIDALPKWNDSSFTLEERARAYLDVNCAHCHIKTGYATNRGFSPAYENSLNDSKIPKMKGRITFSMRWRIMPKIGTTVVDREGLELIKGYVKTLK